MSINLVKGQKIDLSKGQENLNKIFVGLGWDKKSSNGLFGKLSLNQIDCDASVILCKNGKYVDTKDIVSFRHLVHKSGSVKHMGDNLTGAGDGDDERIFVELSKVPHEYDKIVFVVNIYHADSRKQHFGMIKNCFIRIVNTQNNVEICRYNLSENYDDMYAMIFGEIYRKNNEWKFNALGQGTKDKSIDELAKRFS